MIFVPTANYHNTHSNSSHYDAFNSNDYYNTENNDNSGTVDCDHIVIDSNACDTAVSDSGGGTCDSGGGGYDSGGGGGGGDSGGGCDSGGGGGGGDSGGCCEWS